MALAQLYKSYGSSYANFQVVIKDSSGQPSRLYGSNSNLLTDNGQYVLTSSGVLSVYIDDSKPYNVRLIDPVQGITVVNEFNVDAGISTNANLDLGSGQTVNNFGTPVSGGGSSYPYASGVSIPGAVQPAALSVAKAKKAVVKAGTGSMKTLFLGDSTFAGSYGPGAGGIVGARLYCMAQQVANVIGRQDLPAFSENFFGDAGAGDIASTVAAYNPLVVLGSGWASDVTITTLGGRPISSTTASTALTYNGWSDVDTFDIYYRVQSGGAAFVLSRTGDASSGSISSAGAEGVAKVTFTGLLGVAALTITHDATTNPLHILGIDAYNSTIPQVRCISGAYAGSKVSHWADASQPYSARSMTTLLAPDLTIISPGINDWAQATTLGNSATAGTFLGDLQLVITAAKASGDVIMQSGFPSYRTYNANTTRAKQKTYVDAMRTLAASNSIPFQETWNKWGLQETNPLWYYNTLHPGAVGIRHAAETLGYIFGAIA